MKWSFKSVKNIRETSSVNPEKDVEDPGAISGGHESKPGPFSFSFIFLRNFMFSVQGWRPSPPEDRTPGGSL